MPIFNKEQRVSLKQNISYKGKINFVMPIDGGHQFYEVLFDNGSLAVRAEHELVKEVNIRTPWDLLSENLLGDYRNFLISTTFHKVRNTTSNTISSLKASRTIFYPYQYKPLVKFLKSDIKRVLVADEVGLGKTIEAGHIMLEMAARGDLKNALIICTNSLRDKWKFELQDKFNFTLKIYNSSNEFVQDINNDLQSSKKSILGIVNYEKFRNIELQRIIEENGYRFDLVICDEAHKIRNSETAQHKGVVKIIDNSDAVVFLTATPIMTDLRNLFNLIRVLDRERYYSFDIFNNAIGMNRPFIRALSKLNANNPLLDIAEELHSSEVKQEMTADEIVYNSKVSPISELFQDDELYGRARNNMLNGDDSVENRVKIQQDLIELNSLNHLYTRTRKKDVMSAKDVVKREPRTIAITLSNEERQIYNDLIEEYDNENNLGLIQRKRQMSSCIAAFRTPREILLTGEYDKSLADAKFGAFEGIVREIVLNKGNKLIVFAFFTNTLLYLKIKLKELGIETEIIYGGIKDRTVRIENFQHNNNVKILLSSEVGSEGIDLQFCDALVNYDLPWNPMVVEQRIGRIDRVGQKSNVINIYNLILKDTIEERIHTRLYERINLFRESLGDLEEILGDKEPLGDLISKGIESLYKTKLTEAEQNEEIDRLCRAIEGERQTLAKIQSDLSESFANDSHFQNEIENITKNYRYLTKEEIIQYVESIIRIELNPLQLAHINEYKSEISFPANNTNLLFDFIEKHMDEAIQNPELHNMYRTFKSKYIGSRKVELTFDQTFAYGNRSVEYISAFHPVVNAITNYFDVNNYDKNQAHKLAVRKEFIDQNIRINEGYYVLIVYRISVKRFFGDGKSSQAHFLHSALVDLNEEAKILSKEVSDHINGVVQLHGENIRSDINLDKDFVDEIRPFIMMEIKKVENDVIKDEEIKFLSSIKRRTQQELDYKKSRISRMESQLRDGRGIETILLSNIKELKQEENQLILNRENAKIEVNNSLISANLLQVI